MHGSGDLGVAGVANVSFLTPFRLDELLSVGELPGKPRHFEAVSDHNATERALAATFAELSTLSPAGLAAIGRVRRLARMVDLNELRQQACRL